MLVVAKSLKIKYVYGNDSIFSKKASLGKLHHAIDHIVFLL